MNEKLLAITLIVLVVGAVAFTKMDMTPTTVEGLGMLPARSLKSMPSFKPTGSDSHMEMTGTYFYQPTPGFQANLSPRFSNVDYGANIRYNLPSTRHMATPRHPLGQNAPRANNAARRQQPRAPMSGRKAANMVRENYGHNTSTMPHESSYATSLQSAYDGHKQAVVSSVPVGDLTAITPAGDVQGVAYNNLIYANLQNTRLRAQGDKIRGDLPIVPCETGWFRPSVNPTVDLEQGAMYVLGGLDNQVTTDMARLLHKDTYQSTIAGMQLTPKELVAMDAGSGNVSVQANV